MKNRTKRQLLRDTLQEVNDIERLLSRLSVGLGNGRDLVNLKTTLQTMLVVKKHLAGLDSSLIKVIANNITTNRHNTKLDNLEAIIEFIEKHIIAEPPISIREGGMIQTGINKELDSLRKIVNGSRDWIRELEKQERERTGIGSLKVRFHQVIFQPPDAFHF